MTTTDKKAEPFRITEEGIYRLRNYKTLNIRKKRDREFGFDWLWTTDDPVEFDSWGKAWRNDGSFDPAHNKKHQYDIVARLDEQAEEMSGRYIQVHPDGAVSCCQDQEKAQRIADNGGKVFDISNFPVAKKLKPERKVETRKVLLGIWPDGRVDVIRQRYERHTNMVAIVEQEITFTHGEGWRPAK